MALTLPPVSSLEALPNPVVSDILPNFGSVAGNYQVIIKGGNLATTSSVKFGTKKAVFHVIVDDSISVIVPTNVARLQAYPIPVGGGGPSSHVPPSTTVSVTVKTVAGMITLPGAFTLVR